LRLNQNERGHNLNMAHSRQDSKRTSADKVNPSLKASTAMNPVQHHTKNVVFQPFLELDWAIVGVGREEPA